MGPTGAGQKNSWPGRLVCRRPCLYSWVRVRYSWDMNDISNLSWQDFECASSSPKSLLCHPELGVLAFTHNEVRRVSPGKPWALITEFPKYWDGNIALAGNGAVLSTSRERVQVWDAPHGGVRDISPGVRQVSTLVALGDGRVLATGYVDLTPAKPGDPDNSCWAAAWDPSTDQWQEVAVPDAGGCDAITLRDGRALILSQGEAFLFDGKRDRFTNAGGMSAKRLRPGLAVLASGRVLVAGGQKEVSWAPGVESGSQRSADLFDPDTGDWTPLPPMMMNRGDCAAVVLPDGRAMIIGGLDSGTKVQATEIFDPTTSTWSMGPPLQIGPQRRTYPRGPVLALPDGRVLVVDTDERRYSVLTLA